MNRLGVKPRATWPVPPGESRTGNTTGLEFGLFSHRLIDSDGLTRLNPRAVIVRIIDYDPAIGE